MAEPGTGSAGDNLDREGLAVSVVEGELSGGVGGGLKGVRRAGRCCVPGRVAVRGVSYSEAREFENS